MEQSQTDRSPLPSASVVIATVGRPECVLSCVWGMAQAGVPPDVEVLVVDAAARSAADRTDSSGLAKAWPNSRVVPCEIRNAGVQRNLGVELAAHDTIIFLDDDALVQPGWWPAIIEPLLKPETGNLKPEEAGRRSESSSRLSSRLPLNDEHWDQDSEDGVPVSWVVDRGSSANSLRSLVPGFLSRFTFQISSFGPGRGIGAVAGGVWVNPDPKLTDKRGGYVNWRGEPIQVTHRGSGAPRWVDWPLTTNMAVRREVFLRVGGFSPIYGIYDEDVDLGLKIRRAGYRIAFAPEAAVYHYFLKRPRQPPTKATAFRDGRNRAILLVRHYGRSARLPLFLLTAPWIRGWETLRTSALYCLKQAGHFAAYLTGIAAGLVVGLRNPAGRDRRP